MHPAMDSTADTDKQHVAGESLTDAGQDADDVIARYEEMFASRYTPEDPMYLPYIDKGMDPPPLVENYHVRRQRQPWNDNSRDQRYGQDRGHKRRYGDAGWQDDRGHWKSQPHHQWGGQGHRQGNRGWDRHPHPGNQGWGHHQVNRGWDHHQGNRDHRQSTYPPQDRRQWDGSARGARHHEERPYDSRNRGHHSGRPEQRSQDAHPQPPQDEWT